MASLIGVNVRTLEKWMESRTVRFIRVGGTVLFDPDEVVEDLKKFQVATVHGE